MENIFFGRISIRFEDKYLQNDSSKISTNFTIFFMVLLSMCINYKVINMKLNLETEKKLNQNPESYNRLF